MTVTKISDEAAGLFNAKLIGVTIKALGQIRAVDREQTLAECLPAITQFSESLAGKRRSKISAWISLDMALRNRMEPGGVRSVALALTGRARKIMLSEGGFKQGERVGFDLPVRSLATEP